MPRCRCNAEFCYICGTKWRNCDCPRWHEGRLLARAEHLVDRPREDNDHRPLDVRDRAVRIREATNYLLAGPECDHNNWEYIEGVGTCEICDYTGLVYIYLCRGCGTTSCNWCNTMAREEQEPRARVNRRQGRNGFRGRGSGRRASARV